LDVIFGRTNALIQSNGLGINYIEQAYISVKPPKARDSNSTSANL